MEVLDYVNEVGGYFMIDSGAFSYINMNKKDVKTDITQLIKPEYWLPYLNEYVEFVDRNIKKIYCAANFDLDIYLGPDKIVEWNEEYFSKFTEKTNVIYVAHKLKEWGYHNLQRLREYASMYEYVGVNAAYHNDLTGVAQIARANGNRIHGFAITAMGKIKQNPLFSVDSVTWHMGEVYGVTYRYDGKNFKTYNKLHKYRRKADKVKIESHGMNYEGIIGAEMNMMSNNRGREKSYDLEVYNLLAWKEAEKDYYKQANIKLLTNTVDKYDKRRKV
jgi:hypothetical protein